MIDKKSKSLEDLRRNALFAIIISILDSPQLSRACTDRKKNNSLQTSKVHYTNL